MGIHGPEYEQIARTIPGDHARTSSAEDMVAEALARCGADPPKVLDLGCGDGRGLDVIRALAPTADYTGCDIEVSPEVASRTREDGRFVSYNGTDLPFADDSFDIVYSRQVFEHVRHPDRVVAEIARVLKPGGIFAGSLSNLEPYHSFSIFNYTPYGLFRIVEDNGLVLDAMRPGIEGMALIARQLSMRTIGRLPLAYPLFAIAAKLKGWDARTQNYAKLRFSGHICFLARKP